jgi:hypothetical protein
VNVFTQEPLTGGLVTAQAPTELEKGEVQRILNCIYWPNNAGPGRAPGMSLWNGVDVNADTTGLAAVRFDNGTQKLLAQNGGKLWLANGDIPTSSFASAVNQTDGAHLVAVPYDSRAFIFNGANDNWVLQQDGTLRQHGLNSSTTTPQDLGMVSTATFSASATGWYEYWYTEVLRMTDGIELENSFTGKPLSINVTSLSSSPKIGLPSQPANTITGTLLKYRIYRSEQKQLQNDVLFPVGRKLGDIDPTTTFNFTDTTTTSNTGAHVAASNDSAVVSNNATVTLDGGAASIADACSVDDSTKYVKFTCGTQAGSTNAAKVTLYNFGLGAFVGNIVGILVKVQAKATAANIGDLAVCVGERTSANTFKDLPITGQYPNGVSNNMVMVNSSIGIRVPLTALRQTITTTTDTDYNFGGTAVKWIPNVYGWTASQFDSDFGVQLAAIFSSAAGSTDAIRVDLVQMTIYYAGTDANVEKGDIYDAITVADGDFILNFASRARPPMASTAAFFEGCLVTNDVTKPGRLYWSVPGEPESFPTDIYYLDLPGGQNDAITFIGTVGTKLVVGRQSSLYRINYLPLEQDASFSRGRAHELISDTIGIINPVAACLYIGPDGRQELAFVDGNGLFATDGFAIRSLVDDLTWVDLSRGVFTTQSSVFTDVYGITNNPYLQCLIIGLGNGYYSASYAKRHRKGDQPKWAGAVDIRYTISAATYVPKCMTTLRAGGIWITVFGYDTAAGVDGGQVWRTDSSDTFFWNSLPSNAFPIISTRNIFPNGLMDDAILKGIGLHGTERGISGVSTNPVKGNVSIAQLYYNLNPGTAVTATFPNPTVGTDMAYIPFGSLNANGYTISVSATATGRTDLNSLWLELEGSDRE